MSNREDGSTSGEGTAGLPGRIDGRLGSSWPLELAIGLGLLALAQQLFAPGDPLLLSVSPHPLLALVAVLAVRHGNPAGLVAGLIAAALHVFGQVLVGPAATDAWALAAVHPEVPLELLAGGGLLAELVRGTRDDLRRARDRDRRAADRARHAEAALDELAARFAETERRLLEPAAQVAELHRHVSRLDTLDENDLLRALADVVKQHLGAGAAWLYLVDGTHLVLRASAGEHEFSSADHGEVGRLCRLALDEQRVASPRDLGAGSSAPLNVGSRSLALAAPLLGRRGTPLGAVAALEVPFLSMTDATERVLAMLADLGARALERARVVRQSRVIDEQTGLATYAYFCDRLAEELHRWRRHEAPLSVLVARVARPESVPAEARAGLMHVLAHSLRDVLRQTDLAGHFREPLGVAAVLPATGAEGAATAARRLRETIAILGLRPYSDGAALVLTVGTASAVEGTRSPADLIAAAVHGDDPRDETPPDGTAA